MDKKEFIDTALELTKARLGISTTVRDELLLNAVKSVIEELEQEKQISLDYKSPMHLDFVKDYATWRYQSVNSTGVESANFMLSMPRHLQFRLHNLSISQLRNDEDVQP